MKFFCYDSTYAVEQKVLHKNITLLKTLKICFTSMFILNITFTISMLFFIKIRTFNMQLKM